MFDVRETWTRTWPSLLAVGVVSAVGAPAAVASYRHARDVVASTGDTVMAPWLPLSVDGLLVAALVVIWVRRRRGERAGRGPWGAFLFGMVVTILANLAAVTVPSVKAYAVALFPPLAFAITLELVALVAHRAPVPAVSGRPLVADLVASRTVPVEASEPVPTERPQDVVPGPSPTVPEPSRETSPNPSPEPVPTRSDPTSREERKRVADLRRWIGERQGDVPSPYAVRKRIGCSQRTAERLLSLAAEEPRMTVVS